MKKATARKEVKAFDLAMWEVTNVKSFDWGTVFNLSLNGILIYGCRLVETADAEFIGFPSQKGKDGKYYSHVYWKFTEADEEAIINEVHNQMK